MIKINPSQIYDIKSHDIIKNNAIKNIEYSHNVVDTQKEKFFEYSVTFPESILLKINQGNIQSAQEIIKKSNANIKNIRVFSEPYNSGTAYYLYFEYPFVISDEIPIHNLNVITKSKISVSRNPNEKDTVHEDEFEIFNPDNSKDLNFRIVKSKAEFNSLQRDARGKIGLEYLGNKKFNAYNEILFLVTAPSLIDFCYYRNLYFYKTNVKKENISLTNNINNVYSFQSNELINQKNMFGNISYEDLNKQILKDWSNGKETAVIQCSIGEYYDTGGSLVISTKKNGLPMTFQVGDLVVPYIAGKNNQPIPLSQTKDGSPKSYKITKVEVYFDGACWQDLTLQEGDDVFFAYITENFYLNRFNSDNNMIIAPPKLVGFSYGYIESVEIQDIDNKAVWANKSLIDITVQEDKNSFLVENVSSVGDPQYANITFLVKYKL